MKLNQQDKRQDIQVTAHTFSSQNNESSNNNITLFNKNDRFLHQTTEDNRIELFVKQPNSPSLQSYALKNGQALPSSTTLIGENYANRQREGPCSLALSCMKPKMPQKRLNFGKSSYDHSSESSDSKESRDGDGEDMAAMPISPTKAASMRASTAALANPHGLRSHPSSPLRSGVSPKSSGGHSRYESAGGENHLNAQGLANGVSGGGGGEQTNSNRLSMITAHQQQANAVTSPSKRLFLVRRNSSTSAMSGSQQPHVVSPEKDKRAVEQELQEQQQQKLVSLLGLSLKKKLMGMMAHQQQKDQQLQQMQRMQTKSSHLTTNAQQQQYKQSVMSHASYEKFNDFLQASLSPKGDPNTQQQYLATEGGSNSSPSGNGHQAMAANGASQTNGAQGMPLETLRIFQLFKVPMMKLKQIHTLEGKIEFLIEHAQNNIRDQLRTIDQMESERQQNIKIFKKQMRDQFNDEHFQGLYSWLKVNSPGHEGLIKKLRTKLIESLQTQDVDDRPRSARFHPTLRDSKHLSKVIGENPGTLLVSGAILNEAVAKTFKPFVHQSLHTIEQQQALAKKKGDKSALVASPHQRKEVKKFKNLNDMMKDLDREAKDRRKSQQLRPKTSKAFSSRKLDPNEEGEGGQSEVQLKPRNDEVAKFFDTLPAQSWDDIREREKRQQMDQLMKQFQLEGKQALEKGQILWNDKLERVFSSHKKDIRLGLTQYSSTGPWNKVVLGQMDQLRSDMPKNTTSQKDLQKAYASLKYERVKEIVSTIPSLNECLDKRLFQKNVNSLPRDHMNAIETQIAEDILWTYTRNKHSYQSARNKFFKERVRTSAEKIKDNQDKFEAKAKSVERKGEYKKLSKRYRTILNGLQKGTVSLKSPQTGNQLHIQKLYTQGLHHLFEPKPLQMAGPKGDQANEYLNTRMALDQFQAVSKVNSQPKYDRAVPHKFFIEKYAGGPSSNKERRRQVSIHDIVRAAVKIQSWARIVIARKVARDKKNEFERQKFFYEENLKRQQEKLERERFYRQSAGQQDAHTPKNNQGRGNNQAGKQYDTTTQTGVVGSIAMFQTHSSYLNSSPSPSGKSKASRQLNYSQSQSVLNSNHHNHNNHPNPSAQTLQQHQSSLFGRSRIPSASRKDLKFPQKLEGDIFSANKNQMLLRNSMGGITGGPSSTVLLNQQHLQVRSSLNGQYDSNGSKNNQSLNGNSRRPSVAKSQMSNFRPNFSTTSKGGGLDLRDLAEMPSSLDLKEKTYKTPGQLRKNMQMVLANMFQACKKGNWNYIDKNRERLTLEVLQDTRDAKGNTPLYVATANKHFETVKYLLGRGVLATTKNENGNTALHRAFMNQDYELIGLLKDRGGSYEALNDLNQTPLYFGSRSLIAKLGIQSKPVNFMTPQEATSKFSHEKTSLVISKAKDAINENPDLYMEEGEDKESVIRGVAQRLSTKEMVKDFAPLYSSAKHSKNMLQ